MKKITGKCFCGKISYEIIGEIKHSSICHCSGCRKASAAPAVAWITVDASSFKIIKGQLSKIRAKENEYGACYCVGERTFCPNCGTHITFIGDNRKNEIDITTGSIDDPDIFPPEEDHAIKEKVSWVNPFCDKKN